MTGHREFRRRNKGDRHTGSNGALPSSHGVDNEPEKPIKSQIFKTGSFATFAACASFVLAVVLVTSFTWATNVLVWTYPPKKVTVQNPPEKVNVPNEDKNTPVPFNIPVLTELDALCSGMMDSLGLSDISVPSLSNGDQKIFGRFKTMLENRNFTLDDACFLIEQLLCAEMSGGQHPYCNKHEENRQLLEVLRSSADFSVTDQAAGILGDLLGFYDFSHMKDWWEPLLGQENTASKMKSYVKKEMLRSGMAVLPQRMDEGWMKSVFSGLENSIFEKRGAAQPQQIQGIHPDKIPEDWGGGAFWLHNQNEALEIPEVSNLAFDPIVLDLVQDYLQAPPILRSVDVWFTLPAANSNQNEFAFNDWHVDFNSLKDIKLFVFLTSTTNETGAHVSFPSQATKFSFLANDSLSQAVSDQQIPDEAIPDFIKTRIETHELPPGSVVLEDTRIVHRASPVHKTFRVAMQFIYMSSGFCCKFHNHIYEPANRVPSGLEPVQNMYPRLFQNLKPWIYDDIPKQKTCAKPLELHFGSKTKVKSPLPKPKSDEIADENSFGSTHADSSKKVLGDPSPITPKTAFVMMAVGDVYTYAAIFQAFALRKRLGITRDIILLGPRNMTEIASSLHSAVKDLDLKVMPFPAFIKSAIIDGDHTGGIEKTFLRKRHWLAMAKMSSLGLTEYDRIVLIDVDIYIENSLDFLFQLRLRPHQFASGTLQYCTSQGRLAVRPELSDSSQVDKEDFKWGYGIATGVLAFNPSQSMYDEFFSFFSNNIRPNEHDQKLLYRLVREQGWPSPVMFDYPFKALVNNVCKCNNGMIKSGQVYAFGGKKPWSNDSWKKIHYCSPMKEQASSLPTSEQCYSDVWCRWVTDTQNSIEGLGLLKEDVPKDFWHLTPQTTV